MTTGAVRELTERIEEKLRETHELRVDLRELIQDLRTEKEREGNERLIHGTTVREEELEWDIHITEAAIRGISEEIEVLRERLDKLTRSRPIRRPANE